MADHDDKDQKTEEATPRRRSEARDRGQVAMSQELIAALSLCAGMAALAVGGGQLWRMMGFTVVTTCSSLAAAATRDLTVPGSAKLLRTTFEPALASLAWVVLPVVLISAVVGYAQAGFLVTPKAIEVDPSKVNPFKGFGRLMSVRSAVRTFFAGAKVMLVAATMALIARYNLPNVIEIGTAELGPLLAGLGVITLRCTSGAILVILVLGLIDLVFQRFQHARDLRMSKQEVKEEHRLTEGDPHVKSRARQIQREMASRRMMAEVPKATVVVTNPTHFAVALRYDRDEAQAGGGVEHRAPLVVAKGVDHVAQRIKAVARDADVVCYEDVPLARSLYRQVEIGQEIPEELYAAVATVLGYVYGLRREAAPAAA